MLLLGLTAKKDYRNLRGKNIYFVTGAPTQKRRQDQIVYAKVCSSIALPNPWHRSVYKIYRVMRREKLSTHCPQEPEMPAMLYPRGGINVWLDAC